MKAMFGMHKGIIQAVLGIFPVVSFIGEMKLEKMPLIERMMIKMMKAPEDDFRNFGKDYRMGGRLFVREYRTVKIWMGAWI
jgi:hypothetical protein